MADGTDRQPVGGPNLLFILTDQHAPHVAGFAGNAIVETQNLDRLAARSVQFDTAICPSPCCTPSRMSILTAKDIHHCSAWANHWVIFPEHTTWPQHFEEPDTGPTIEEIWEQEVNRGAFGGDPVVERRDFFGLQILCLETKMLLQKKKLFFAGAPARKARSCSQK